jgi:hypothetical protein
MRRDHNAPAQVSAAIRGSNILCMTWYFFKSDAGPKARRATGTIKKSCGRYQHCATYHIVGVDDLLTLWQFNVGTNSKVIKDTGAKAE